MIKGFWKKMYLIEHAKRMADRDWMNSQEHQQYVTCTTVCPNCGHPQQAMVHLAQIPTQVRGICNSCGETIWMFMAALPYTEQRWNEQFEAVIMEDGQVAWKPREARDE